MAVNGNVEVGGVNLASGITSPAQAPYWNSTATTGSVLTWQLSGNGLSSVDRAGNTVPSFANPSTYYVCEEWDIDGAPTDYAQNGNVVITGVNTVNTPLQLSSSIGISYVNTSSTTAGGYVCRPLAYSIVKSTTINYQFRHLFYLPAASTALNRYSAYIGNFVVVGTANNTAVPFAGPYIAYSDNLNSGNWVLGSAVNNSRITGSSAAAVVPNTWNSLLITLNNGTYSYSLNGVSLGTLLDPGITPSPSSAQGVTLGGIMCIPDGTNFTTSRTLMIDRSDLYITGLSR